MSTAAMNFGIPLRPTVATTHLRLTPRGRRFLATVAAAPLVIAAFLFALNGGQATAVDSSAPLEYVTVEPGQSLWRLAGEIAPTADPRDVVDGILSLNAMESTQLVPGQRLAVPSEFLR